MDHSSQKGPKDRNLGVYNRLLERSDPVILRDMTRNSRNRKKFSSATNSLPITLEVLALCKDPTAVDPLARLPLVDEDVESDNNEDVESDSEAAQAE